MRPIFQVFSAIIFRVNGISAVLFYPAREDDHPRFGWLRPFAIASVVIMWLLLCITTAKKSGGSGVGRSRAWRVSSDEWAASAILGPRASRRYPARAGPRGRRRPAHAPTRRPVVTPRDDSLLVRTQRQPNPKLSERVCLTSFPTRLFARVLTRLPRLASWRRSFDVRLCSSAPAPHPAAPAAGGGPGCQRSVLIRWLASWRPTAASVTASTILAPSDVHVSGSRTLLYSSRRPTAALHVENRQDRPCGRLVPLDCFDPNGNSSKWRTVRRAGPIVPVQPTPSSPAPALR